MQPLYPKKILVVDDEEDAVVSLSNILRRAQYAVIATTKGEEAIALSKQKLPDLIIRLLLRIYGCEALNFSHNSLKHMMLSCFPWLNLFDSNLIIVAVAVDSVGNPVFRGFSIESTVFLILGQKAAPTDSVEEPIILDILLPDIDGGSVAEILSQEPSTAGIPIIFLTGILSKEEELVGKQQGGRKSGKHYMLAKPVTKEDLLQVVQKILPA